jgi:hypothetical protein
VNSALWISCGGTRGKSSCPGRKAAIGVDFPVAGPMWISCSGRVDSEAAVTIVRAREARP